MKSIVNTGTDSCARFAPRRWDALLRAGRYGMTIMTLHDTADDADRDRGGATRLAELLMAVAIAAGLALILFGAWIERSERHMRKADRRRLSATQVGGART